MTALLREFIKQRDNYTCKTCPAPVAISPNLLLEVDHIIPVSKDGMSAVENLQTRCCRCNRCKSNKILVG
ncbi:HNH endonuclease [Microbacterium sp.]|uniref:HNH endonuclease n=1 Tax=Microbacterium sp. TaxID=51671 RepID=UPI0037CB59EE